MELTQLTLQVFLLFFPGIICALVVEALTPDASRSNSGLGRLLIASFVLGISTYLVLFAGKSLLHFVCGVPGDVSLTFFEFLANADGTINWGEITVAALLAVPLGFAVAAVLEHNLLHRVANAISASRQYGDLDVWSLMLNSPEVVWVVVRDLQHDLMYEGWGGSKGTPMLAQGQNCFSLTRRCTGTPRRSFFTRLEGYI